MVLPDRFRERTILLLGAEEAEELFCAIENADAVKAFRVNQIKSSLADFETSKPRINREKIAFPPNAYITREEFPGSLPEHHSGAIYMQDVSAMSTVHAVSLHKGARVLDSCSAPGGKTTQLASAVGEIGIVVANEYDRKRCAILRSNIERMGCKNTVVCNLDTAVLAEVYPESFDLVLCDAPCSGEGMFRKNERAIEEWSEENVKMCAERQREILENVAKCVRAGGKLLYSTCTFAVEENEENVKWFLDSHPDFALCEVEDDLKNNTADGLMIIDCDYDMTLCRRIYPHRSLGEGQFIALFERVGGLEHTCERSGKKKREKGATEARRNRAEGEMIRVAEKFLKENLKKEALERLLDGSCGIFELKTLGESVYLSPKIDLPPYGVFSAGVCVGEVSNGRMVPHHQLFSACGNEFEITLEIDGESAAAKKYLRGEEIDAVGVPDGVNGWCAVMIDGCAVGGGKISLGRCKNHYPKGLRK